MACHNLYEMTTLQVKALSEKTNLVFLPVGPTEVHSLHLPTGTDIQRAIVMSEMTAERLWEKDGIESMIAPPINYAPSDATFVYPGSTTIRTETAILLVEDVCLSMIKWGFDRIMIMCGHHDPSCMNALEEAAENVMTQHKEAKILVAKWSPNAPVLSVMKNEHPEWDIHAGELETSVMMVHCPDLVNTEIMKQLEPNWQGKNLFAALEKGMDFIEAGADQAYLGDPRCASLETGKKILEIQCDYAYDEVKHLLS